MRDADLIIKGSVCQSSFYDDGILTLADARKAGTKDCRFLASCNSKFPPRRLQCIARIGKIMAESVAKGSTLDAELKEFTPCISAFNGFFDPWESSEGEPKVYTDQVKIIRLVREWATRILGSELDAPSLNQQYVVPPGKEETKFPVLAESTWDGQQWMHNCGSLLAAVEVHHSIHDGPAPLSGSGRVHLRMTPYCPKCQERPSEIGVPLKEDPGDAQDMEILRRMGQNL